MVKLTRMKNCIFIILLILGVEFFYPGLSPIFAAQKAETNIKDVTKELINEEPKEEQEEQTEEPNEEQKNLLLFQTKKAYLWVKDSSLAKDKNIDDFIEVSLPGELYEHPKKILTVSKKEVDRSTLDGIAVSLFSANKAGDLKWITSNFVDDEQNKIKTLFKNKTVLRDSQKDFQNIKTIYLTGQAEYKDYIILFVKENYQSGKKVTEAIACKQIQDGWRITNALADDETYDVVFAALSNGKVTDQIKN